VTAGTRQIYFGLASCYTRLGQPALARDSLVKALQLYPRSSKLHVALGKALLAHRRLKAALRRFEATLALSADPADDITVEARMHAGLCGLRIAQHHNGRAAELLPKAEARLGRAMHDHPEGGGHRAAIEDLLLQVMALRSKLGLMR